MSISAYIQWAFQGSWPFAYGYVWPLQTRHSTLKNGKIVQQHSFCKFWGQLCSKKKNLKKNFSATSKNCNFFQILVHCTTSATYSGVFVQLFCIHFINNNIVHFNVRTLSDFVCYVDNFQTAMKIVYYNFWGTVYRIGIIYLFFLIVCEIVTERLDFTGSTVVVLGHMVTKKTKQK